MSGWQTVRLIMWREIFQRLRGRATWIMTAATTLFVVGLIVIPALVSGTPKPMNVGLVGPGAQAAAAPLQAAANAVGIDITTTDVATGADATVALTPVRRSGAALNAALDLETSPPTVTVYSSLAPELGALLQAVVSQAHQANLLAEAGVDAATIAAAQQPLRLTTVTLQTKPPDQTGRRIAALGSGLLLYVSLGIFGAAVAGGVAQEKTSRVAEVLLSAVTPSELMTGKVLGIGIAAVGQMAVTIVAGLIANGIVRSTAIPSDVWSLLPVILLWFALGYVLYAFFDAAVGAMVARPEEVQSASAPFAIFLIGGFLLDYALIASPDALWIKILSYLPPLAPILMPARLALGSVALWEMPVAIVIMLAAIWGMARFAGRIYRVGIISGGARMSWRSALSLN